MPSKLSLLYLLPVMALAALAACGGDDDDDATAFSEGGPVVCDRLSGTDSYTYNARFSFTTDAPEVRPTDVKPGPDDAEFIQEVEGQVEDQDSYVGIIQARDTFHEYPAGAVYDNGRVWRQIPAGWTEEEGGDNLQLNLIPHRPVALCQAIAQDIDTTWDSESEEVNGAESHRFDVSSWPSDFLDRAPDLGPGSDIATLVNEFDGSIWVADSGAYVSKMELAGSGTYEDGTTLDVTISYEITEMGADVDIDPPPTTTFVP